MLNVNIGLGNYYYIGGLVLGAIIPDLDHHSSVVNRRLLIALELILKILIPGVLYKALTYTTLELPLILGAVAITIVALIKVNLKKKWALKLLYVLFALLLISYLGINIVSLFSAITLVCTGYFPHRGYTHKWYGLAMISISLYLMLGINGLFVGCVVGMISHIGSDGVKSALHI
jgi:membrane-bound metal-dependent hydrolase YbcI (DUF457 family)